MKTILFTMLTLGFTLPLLAQTSEDNPRLQQALKRYPDADKDKDGILTVEEAKAYLKQNPDIRRSGQRGAQQQRGGGKAQAPTGGQRHIYKTAGDVELPLYVFSPEDHNAESKTPAVVFFFGGGWKSGSPKQFQPQCEHLAKRGMVGITVEYRVSSRHPVKVEDCIEDAKSAIRWVRANAAKLGVDPDRIASGGGSAGGHLAACTAVIEELNADSDDLQVSAKPNAMLLYNPAMALAADKRMSPEIQRRENPLADRIRTSPKNVSPLNFAATKQPPMIMFFGTDDRLLRGAQLFMQDSEEAGNSCKLVTYEGQGHGFFNRGKYLELTTAEMDKFLVELGWLKP